MSEKAITREIGDNLRANVGLQRLSKILAVEDPDALEAILRGEAPFTEKQWMDVSDFLYEQAKILTELADDIETETGWNS